MTKEELAAIKERAENATPGPWRWTDARSKHTLDYPPGTQDVVWDGTTEGRFSFSELVDPDGNYLLAGAWCNDDTADVSVAYEDAAFIQHARQDIPALLAEVERLRELLRGHHAALRL
jgi:hypothetical protein